MNGNEGEQTPRTAVHPSPASAPATRTSEYGELFELLRFVMVYCKQRLQVLSTMEEAELQTKTVNRQAVGERCMLLSVLLKVIDVTVTLLKGPNHAADKNPGRAPTEILEKIMQKNMEAFFKGLR
jgi:hypothetical protein